MVDSSARIAEVRKLVAQEDPLPGDRPDVVGELQRLCRAAVRAIPAAGVAVCLISERDAHVTLAASGPAVERVEELQFSHGEGPCLAAFTSRRPVLVADIRDNGSSPWPVYAAAAAAQGVRAVHAFPLQIGAARLGAMGVYGRDAGGLSLESVGLALTFAEVATTCLLDAQTGVGLRDRVLDDAVDNRYVVFQAQGMVGIQLGVGLAEAMARIRAHAYADNRRLNDVAEDIIAGRLVLGSDAS